MFSQLVDQRIPFEESARKALLNHIFHHFSHAAQITMDREEFSGTPCLHLKNALLFNS